MNKWKYKERKQYKFYTAEVWVRLHIYQAYQAHLKTRNEIDFSDMINLATEHVAAGRYPRKLSYIIIDEFQDISMGRYKLIAALKSQNPACK
ncbi:MAG: UvrD-helicase domain-containing protein, partial [Sphingobacteriales bacterium]